MPEKEWLSPLRDFQLLIHRDTFRGRMTSFAVLLLALHDGKWQCVTRYDTAHGFAHRDVLGLKEGLRGKLLLPNLSYAEAFRYAILDLKQNAEIYHADFLAH